MDIVEVIIKYWAQWLCGIVAAGIILWAKHVIKLEKENAKHIKQENMKEACNGVIDELTEKINKVEQKSDNNDRIIREDLEVLSNSVNNLTVGILSMQGKQFRNDCVQLLNPDHQITLDEYEQFEEDYGAYKGLGGNHTGDALRHRVIEKFHNQIATPGK